MPVDTLIITPDRNTSHNDYKGAFEPEAIHYQRAVPGHHKVVKIDVSKSMTARRKQLFEVLTEAAKEARKYRAIAFFCHGWADGIQVGVRKANLPDLVKLIAACTKNGTDERDLLHVMLFCCSTAAAPHSAEAESEVGGDGGFADTMRDQFCAQGKPWVKIFGHTSKGHTTRNPEARWFEGKGSPVGGIGGEWLVRRPPPKNPLWSIWYKALTAKPPFDKGTMPAPAAYSVGLRGNMPDVERKHLRFHAPYMTIAELHSLLAPKGVV